MSKCPFCTRNVRTTAGLYWHFIFKHVITGRMDEQADQEPLPALPPPDDN